jgi:tetratricopeptide (TPR) repeat protein
MNYNLLYRKLFVFLFILYSSSFIATRAQQLKIDSMLAVLKTEKEDTNKVNALNVLSREFCETSKFDSGIIYSDDARILAEKLNFLYGIATAYNNSGIIFWRQGNYSKALEYSFKSLDINKSIGNKNGIGSNLLTIGLVYSDMGNFPQALEYDLKALTIAEELGNKDNVAIDLSNIGTIYAQQDNYQKALEYFTRALDMEREVTQRHWNFPLMHWQ